MVIDFYHLFLIPESMLYKTVMQTNYAVMQVQPDDVTHLNPNWKI